MDQAAAKTPEAEKPLNLSNGVLKRNHHAAFNNHQVSAGAGTAVVYKECLKNHAASLGAHAVDGCGEFMASPTANPADPTSLKCAACGCHRNFHRREPEDVSFPSSNTTPALEYQPHHRHHPPPPPPPPPHGDAGAHSSPSSPSPPPISSSYYPSAPHLLLTLSGGMSSAATTTPQAPSFSNPNGRKRFRTRFTQQQKEKMTEFAEKLGWKMQKRDEELISGFCNEIGVEKGVFKVWMHNNKSNFGRRDQPVSIPSTGGTTTAINNGNGVEFGQNYHENENENEGNNNNDHFQEQNVNRHSDSFSGRVGGPNGSSSSS